MNRFERRTDALISRHRGTDSAPTRQEIDDLYTDGCAELLEVELHYLRVKRRLRAAEMDVSVDPDAAERIASLSSERDQLERRCAELRTRLRHLHTAVEWKREAESAQSA